MRRSDWKQAESHVEQKPEADYLTTAERIRNDFFSNKTDTGLIYLREHPNYQRQSEEFDNYLDDFLRDLSDLFDGVG